jgi:hypothetical protein
MKRTKLPSTVDCCHCKRRLNFMQYISGSPADTVEPERIRVIPDFSKAGYTVFCTCGQYMVFRHPSALQ